MRLGSEGRWIPLVGFGQRLLGRELVGYTGKVVRESSTDKDYLVDNPSRRCPVITKARTELGYDPQVTIEEGLRRSMVWYSGNREASDA